MVAPVEPVGLTIGVVALASLFSTCVECFDYFKAGQNLEEDFELLFVKLDIEKTRLLIWGNAVGVLEWEDEEKDSRNFSILSINSTSIFRTSYRRFGARFAGNQSRPTLAKRTRWAIHDKTKFEGLLHHLKDLIDGLNQVVLVKREKQDQIMHSDIVSILDISKLRLIQSACEGNYTTLSKAASTVITASEFGTIDRRNIEEWLGDANAIFKDDDDDISAGPKMNEMLSQDAEFSNKAPIFKYVPDMSYYGSIYFVLSGGCRKQVSRSPCQLSKLGKDCEEEKNSILSLQIPLAWSVGNRISKTLDPSRFTSVDLDDLMGKADDQLTALNKLALPVATVYIYCAPCACLLATAFDICKKVDSRTTTYFQFVVRPDDRLVSNCCSQKDRSLGLVSIIERIRDIESSTSLTNHLCYIDRTWVEQRLYELEEETDQPQVTGKIAEMGGKVLSSHNSEEKTAGIVILGELEYCLPIIRSPPFPSNPRIPKETEIFQMKNRIINKKYEWVRTFLGTYTAKAIPIMSPSTLYSSETS